MSFHLSLKAFYRLIELQCFFFISKVYTARSVTKRYSQNVQTETIQVF